MMLSSQIEKAHHEVAAPTVSIINSINIGIAWIFVFIQKQEKNFKFYYNYVRSNLQ